MDHFIGLSSGPPYFPCDCLKRRFLLEISSEDLSLQSLSLGAMILSGSYQEQTSLPDDVYQFLVDHRANIEIIADGGDMAAV